MIFRSITGRSEIDLLVSRSAKREVSAQWVTGLLERGESRLPWCRMALSGDGELLAAQAMDSWSLDRDPGDTPTFVHLLGHADEAAAVALLNHDLRMTGAATVDARLVSEADAPAELRTLREGQQRVLEAAGFTGATSAAGPALTLEPADSAKRIGPIRVGLITLVFQPLQGRQDIIRRLGIEPNHPDADHLSVTATA